MGWETGFQVERGSKVPRSLTRHRSFIHRTLAGTVLGARTGGLGSVTKDVQKTNQRYGPVITSAPEAAQGRWGWGRGGAVRDSGRNHRHLGGVRTSWAVSAFGSQDRVRQRGCEGDRGRSGQTLHLCSSGPDLVQEGPPGCRWSQSSPCRLHRDSGPLRSIAPQLDGREHHLPCPVLKTCEGLHCRVLKEP